MNTEALEAKNILHLQDVYKSYGEKLILDNIDFSVSAGELCTVVGPSGCGKSTLLRLILGQENPDSGKLLLERNEIGEPDRHRGIVFQKYSLFPHLTVQENVMLGRFLELPWYQKLRSKKALRDEAMYFLQRVSLAEHAGKYPHELSGGMQQRVAIAQALIMKPRIIMMDEPFGALDPTTRESMQLFLLELWEEFGMTVFFVTHDLEEAVYLGTRIIVISQHYTDARGEDKTIRRGAKIIADYQLQKKAYSMDVRNSPEFRALVEQIRRDGFDPSHLRHVNEFNLKHPDSFHTLTAAELGK
jgi:NitT/TauT family transport system ATP-binding protein